MLTSQKRVLLGINVDHVASLRQARGTNYPDPVHAALEAELAGADGITVHLREDRRHILDRDVRLLSEVLTTRMNLEMAVTEEMLAIAERIKPAHCCLVPERREELTTEGGLDVVEHEARITDACKRLADAGIRVSLFVDPVPHQLEACLRSGAPDIELHTGVYAEATVPTTQHAALNELIGATEQALEMGLCVNAGHGLHYHNVSEVAAIEGINELNIGHSIVARAMMVGMKDAVKEMRQLISEATK